MVKDTDPTTIHDPARLFDGLLLAAVREVASDWRVARHNISWTLNTIGQGKPISHMRTHVHNTFMERVGQELRLHVVRIAAELCIPRQEVIKTFYKHSEIANQYRVLYLARLRAKQEVFGQECPQSSGKIPRLVIVVDNDKE